ncbi:MAG: DUF3105 domain-containing protein [Acidimicrobiia bacterium]
MTRALPAALFVLIACNSLGGLDVETFPDQGASHVPPDTQPEYNSEPPTSGPHVQAWAPCGIYRQEVPDLLQVHDLEHGVVMVQYDPEISNEDRRALEDLGRALGDHIIVAPRSGMTGPVVLTAWTKLLRLEEVNEEAIRAFYREFAGSGPERVPCPFEFDESA